MIISAIVFFLASILLFVVAPEFWVFEVILLLASLILIVLKLKKEKVLTQNKTQILLKNSITIILVLMIVGLLNFIAVKKSKDIDLTEAGIHTLTDKSLKIVRSIKAPLELTVFSTRQNWEPYLRLLDLYERGSDLISINAIDPVESPLEAKKNGIESEGQILIKYENKTEVVKKVSELGVTNKILKIISNKRRNLCAIEGHGEYSILETKTNGLSFLSQQIKNSSYSLESKTLRDDLSLCDVIMLLGIKSDLLEEEVSILKGQIEKGKSFLFTLGPNFSDFKRTNLFKFLKSLGLEVINSVVIDRLASVHRVDATINVVDSYSNHPIVNGFKEKAYMPLNLSFRYEESNKSIIPLYSSKTFPASWAETNLKSLKKGKAVYDDKDIKGPNHLAVALEDFYRVVVFGSDQFILNAYQGQSSNFNVFFNSIDWLIGEEEIISLDRANLANQSFSLSTPAVNTIFYIVIIFFPFILFVIAGLVYNRNKRL